MSQIALKIESSQSAATKDPSQNECNDKTNDNTYDEVIPPGYTLVHLRKVIQSTSIKEQCTFLANTTDVSKICDYFLALICNDKSLEDMSALYGAVAILYLITDTTQATLGKRTSLLEKVFQEADTLTPYHINYFVEKLLPLLRSTKGYDYMLNLLELLPLMSVASETGKAIAVSLARFIIAEISGKKIILHSFKSFKELISWLNTIKLEEFVQSGSLKTVYIFVHALGFILNAVAFGQNEVFINSGYRNLKPTTGESKKLQTWCENLRQLLEDQTNKNLDASNCDLRMQISRYIMFTILNSLDSDENTFNSLAIT